MPGSDPAAAMGRYLRLLLLSAGLTFLGLWAWIALAPLAYLDPEYPYWHVKLDLLDRCDLGELVVLGDSRPAVGIIPALLPVRATNLAVGGGKPIEALAIARRMLACPDPPTRVILSLDPGHLMLPDLLWERSVRYGLLRRSDLAELADLSAETDDWSVHEARRTDGLPPWARALVYAWKLPPLFMNSVLRAGLFLRWPTNLAARRDGLDRRGQYFFGVADGSAGVALDATLGRFEPAPVLDAAFDRLLAVLHERGIETWFVPMPVNEATWHAAPPGLWPAFDAWLATKAGRYRLLRVVRPTAPSWDNRWFGDGFAHLNPAGAERFSRVLAEAMRGWMEEERRLLAGTLSAAAGTTAQHAE